MEMKNIPVEVITNFTPQGAIVPIKLRYEAEDHSLRISKIISVLYTQENNYAGIRSFDFCCKVALDEKEQMIELRFFLYYHRWVIRRILC